MNSAIKNIIQGNPVTLLDIPLNRAGKFKVRKRKLEKIKLITIQILDQPVLYQTHSKHGGIENKNDRPDR